MSAKLIVTHISPDLDAVASVWLLRRFDKQHFENAGLAFVAAGEKIADSQIYDLGIKSEDVEHVDTGQGRFDHHMEDLALEKVCAASLVFDYLVEKYPSLGKDEALKRLVDHVVEVDHFGEFFWPEPNSDRYVFQLEEILGFIKSAAGTDDEVVEFGMRALDAVHAALIAKVSAEGDLDKGQKFMTVWGEGFAVETVNDSVINLAQKSGYKVVVRKDPEYKNIRIKAVPGAGVDLTPIYEKIIGLEKRATWYLHPSKTMLLNGSDKRRKQVASGLRLDEIINIIKEVKLDESQLGL